MITGDFYVSLNRWHIYVYHYNNSAVKYTMHMGLIPDSRCTVNRTRRETNLSFFSFPRVPFMIDVLHHCLKPMPMMWRKADVCVCVFF